MRVGIEFFQPKYRQPGDRWANFGLHYMMEYYAVIKNDVLEY